MRRLTKLAALVVATAAILLCSALTFTPNAGAASKQTLYVFGFGFYTAPALGAGFPPQTYMKIPPTAVANDYAKHGRFNVSYTFCDTQDTPTGSQACGRQAGSSTGCSGHPCDVVYDIVDLNDQLSIPLISSEGLPIVGEDVNSPTALSDHNLYCLTGTLKVVQQGLGAVLKNQGVTKAGLIGFVTATQQAAENWVKEGFTAQHIALSGVQIVPDTATNLGPAVSSVLGGSANGLIPTASGPGEANAIEYTASTYPKVKMALPSYSYTSSFLHGVPSKDLVGMGIAAWNQPITAMSVPGVKEYWNEVGHTVPAASGFRYYDNSLLSWLGMKFIINVANTVHGNFSSKSMLAALKSAKNINMYGVMPPYSSVSRGKNGAEPCSPYYADVQETVKNVAGSSTPVQVASHPGVFSSPLTGKPVYVDPGLKGK